MLLLSNIKKYKILYSICFLYLIVYLILGIVRHNHFGSYGYDLGIDDQIVWKYSHFQLPITTIDDTPYMLSLTNHVELIYVLLAPFYWIWSDVRMLIILQAVVTVFSAIPLYLVARKHQINPLLSYVLLLSYLTFYGVQHALWFDVHSTPFGASFLSWFLYALDGKRWRMASLAFVLTVLSKENFALLTGLVSVVHFITTRNKQSLFFALASFGYLVFIFSIYFPFFVAGGYHYQARSGLLTQISWDNLYNTHEKKEVLLYSLLSFGFLPLMVPLYLLPFFGSLGSYFILGREVLTAQGLFLQYRIELAPLICFATIIAIRRYHGLNTKYTALYLLCCVLLIQYALHLPLSYVTKQWFWREPASVKDLRFVLTALPADASVVSQNNITPHISHRNDIFTLWPENKHFPTNSPCGKEYCRWFSWGGKPSYMIVDTSKRWDIRHFLTNRKDYLEGLANLEKSGFVKKIKQRNTVVLYHIVKKI
ncbi:DUF2079 domain-containing protein [soil metagenome]